MIATRVFKRLAAMDREELRFRASAALYREAAHVAFAVRRPAWRRRDLAGALREDSPAIAPVVAALTREDTTRAHQLLMRHFVTRESRFVVAPSARAELAAMIRSAFPTATADAIERADRALSGRFDLLGYRNLSFATPSCGIDWHLDPVHKRRAPNTFWSRVPYLDPSIGDHKIIWELNRHQYWILLGRATWLSDDPRYRAGFVRDLESWMETNTPLAGVNWASMLELSLRSLSWLWALHLFASETAENEDEAPWTIDLLLGLDRQLGLVAQNLSRYFSPNTHLLGEALALYVAGRALPELRRAAEWEQIGRSVLVEQIASQILADGGHAERSTHYHRYALDFYLLALRVAIQTSDPATAAFGDAARRLARYARTTAADTGRMPIIGDDDGGMLFAIAGRDPANVSSSLQIAASLLDEPDLAVGPPAEDVLWVTGELPSPAVTTPCRSALLPESGYCVSRSSRGDHLTLDAGPHGFLNGGHAHADALSVTLTVRGRPLLIDPGTGCYTIDPAMRDRFRSSRAHNTLTIDNRSQSVPGDPFHWQSTVDARPLDWRALETFDYMEAAHDGYAPLVHHRAVLVRPACWVIVDRVRGDRRHRADLHWHLDPLWTAALSTSGMVKAEHPDGTVVWIVALHHSCELLRGTDDGSGLGWCAPVYGRLEPATTVRMRSGIDGDEGEKEGKEAPITFVTAIVDSNDQPIVESLSVSGPGQPIGLRITTSSWVDTALFARTADEPGEDGDQWRVGDLVSNSRIACWRETPRSPSRLDRPGDPVRSGHHLSDPALSI